MCKSSGRCAPVVRCYNLVFLLVVFHLGKFSCFATLVFRRTADTFPIFGVESGGLTQSEEEVINGNVELQGWLPSSRESWIADRVEETLAGIAGVPTAQVLVSSTHELASNAAGSEQAMRFHFVLLPVIDTTLDTIDSIREEQHFGDPRPRFLDLLSHHMYLKEPHPDPQGVSLWVKALQYTLYPGAVSHSRRWVWRPNNYRDAASVTDAPNIIDYCSQTYTPCACAQVSSGSGCSWVTDSTTGDSSCRIGSGVSCAACADQAGCDRSSCAVLATPCDCFESSNGCGWDEVSNSCRQGIGTSCAACAKQSSCRTPQAVTFHPARGGSLPADQNLLQIGFDVDIKFRDAQSGLAQFLCVGQATRISIPRPRLVVWNSYLRIDSSKLIGSLTANGTNNARRCSLIIDDSLLSDSFGVAYLGLAAGQYDIYFGDSLPPKLLSLSPVDGGTAQEPVEMVFTFSEPILLSTLAHAFTLAQLDSDGKISSMEQIDAVSSSVSSSGNKLIVNLDGKAKVGNRYTFSLIEGVVTDLSQNKFAGVALHEYSFHTTQVQDHGPAQEDDGLPMYIVMILIAFPVVASFGIVGLMVYRLGCFQTTSDVTSLHGDGSTPKANLTRGASSRSLRSARTTTSVGSRNTSRHSVQSEASDCEGMDAAISDSGGRVLTKGLTSDAFVIPGTPVHVQGVFVKPSPKIRRSQTVHKFEPTDWEKPSAAGQLRRAKSMKDTDGFASSKGFERNANKGTTAQPDLQSAPSSPNPPDESKSKDHARRSDTPTEKKHEQRIPSGSPQSKPEAGARGSSRPSSTPKPRQRTGSPQARPESGSGLSGKASAAEREADPRSPGKPSGSPQRRSETDARSPSKPRARQSWTEAPPPPPTSSTPVQTFEDAEDACANAAIWKEILQQLHSSMDLPIAERKKLIKDFRLKHHPDKNPDDPKGANEVMSKINLASKWFLYESSPSAQDAGAESKNKTFARRSSAEPQNTSSTEKDRQHVPSSSPSPPEVDPRSSGKPGRSQARPEVDPQASEKPRSSPPPRSEGDRRSPGKPCGNPEPQSEPDLRSQDESSENPQARPEADSRYPNMQESRQPVNKRPRPPSLHIEDAMDDDLKKLLREVQQEIFGSWDTPLAERRKVLSGLMLKHHPDKQQTPTEKEIANAVMQQINRVKERFLSE